MSRSVRKAIRVINRIQGDGGEAGCYSELHAVLRSSAGKLRLLESFIGHQEMGRRLGVLSRMAKSLPWLHSEAVVSRRLKEVDELLKM